MHKNIKWANKELKGLSHDKLNELTTQKLTRIENGKQTISNNSSFEARQRGGLTNVQTGHISNLGSVWGPINALNNEIQYSTQLLGAQAMKEKSSTPIIQMDMDRNVIREWNSINDAKRAGYHAGHISNCCNGLKPQYRGFLWEFK
jgi:hypothetical protein